ncbi:uncharacterized protein EI90DRAFT_3286639 [Cantharellus anzutake]|uniref:uncharacterized protein n=1 Tax=Cantharellus anzutake TaxID=1750568 RepID=UPI00190410C6|nr:uncharacterized protein EI90DRAFT_3286639 [Cantharellus anzutake]KAF8339134.1 hypothetical protein EI90DRAFT_3286639 [Cantharellus anzutake]
MCFRLVSAVLCRLLRCNGSLPIPIEAGRSSGWVTGRVHSKWQGSILKSEVPDQGKLGPGTKTAPTAVASAESRLDSSTEPGPVRSAEHSQQNTRQTPRKQHIDDGMYPMNEAWQALSYIKKAGLWGFPYTFDQWIMKGMELGGLPLPYAALRGME